MSILNIFGSTGLAPKNGPPLASPFSTAGGGVRFGEPGRSWCGLPRQPERINLDRVGIQRILQHGRNEKGELVGVIFLAPEFVSARRAEYLVSVNLARFCGFGGEGE